MRIVLTNDDGYQAAGLRALYQAAAALGDVEISIIASEQAFSGKGHVVSSTVRVRREKHPDFASLFIVDGAPADCTRLAVAMPNHPRPDYVLSGITHGGNLGVDIFYSGTVAAAREAAILGIPAIAVSQLTRTGVENDWSRSTAHAAAVIAALLRPDHSPPFIADQHTFARARHALETSPETRPTPTHAALWNVNLPCVQGPHHAPDVVLVPASTDHLVIHYQHHALENGVQQYDYSGNYHDRLAAPGTDVAAVFAGAIAISPLPL